MLGPQASRPAERGARTARVRGAMDVGLGTRHLLSSRRGTGQRYGRGRERTRRARRPVRSAWEGRRSARRNSRRFHVDRVGGMPTATDRCVRRRTRATAPRANHRLRRETQDPLVPLVTRRGRMPPVMVDWYYVCFRYRPARTVSARPIRIAADDHTGDGPLRRILLALVLLGAVGLLVELALLEHFDSVTQWIPLALLVVVVGAAVGVYVRRGPARGPLLPGRSWRSASWLGSSASSCTTGATWSSSWSATGRFAGSALLGGDPWGDAGARPGCAVAARPPRSRVYVSSPRASARPPLHHRRNHDPCTYPRRRRAIALPLMFSPVPAAVAPPTRGDSVVVPTRLPHPPSAQRRPTRRRRFRR